MPFDSKSAITSISDYIANRSIAGNVIGNSLFIGLVVTFIIFLILLMVPDKKFLSFKLMLFIFIVIFAGNLIHDLILTEQINKKFEEEKSTSLMSKITSPPISQISGGSGIITPRPIFINESDEIDESIRSLKSQDRKPNSIEKEINIAMEQDLHNSPK